MDPCLICKHTNRTDRLAEKLLAGLFAAVLMFSISASRAGEVEFPTTALTTSELKSLEQPRILPRAETYLQEPPVTVTAYRAARSKGGVHDFYSEGDYWWPNPDDPDGPYIRRDGLSNPDNFVAHRRAMVRLSSIVGTLTSAYLISGDDRFAYHAGEHLDAWFIDPATRMNPSLNYGQAIKGKVDGRSIGIIDTIHLVEVARGAQVLGKLGVLSEAHLSGV